MTDWLSKIFLGGEAVPQGSREWVLSHEGLATGWAFFIFLLLGAGCVWAYLKCAPGISKRWRTAMIVLRLITLTLFLVLLVRPVLQLTINEPVRQALIVLLDASQSMLLNDHRTTPDDLKRVAIAAGLTNPDAGLKADAPSGTDALKDINRWELLQKLSANNKLNLWKRLAEKSDLVVYEMGRDATQVLNLQQEANSADETESIRQLLASAKPEASVTALGESLRQVLEQYRGVPVSGILAITDGASNTGLPPIEAARLAHEQNIPLFMFGVGVTSPIDLVAKSVGGSQIAFVDQPTEVTAKFTTQGLGQRKLRAHLKANGKEVNATDVELREDGAHDVSFHFKPEDKGELLLEASFDVSPGEVSSANNVVTSKMRTLDKKISVLYIEQEPRWDFRYLFDYLQRDKRLEVKTIMINGDPGLAEGKDSPFLAALPQTKEEIFNFAIIILGDVSPKDLGEARMKLLREWVAEASGGLIFLAGEKNNPSQYIGTPLEQLLPVDPDKSIAEDRRTARALEPFKLVLTAAGEQSDFLKIADDAAESLQAWRAFTGVRWTAAITRAKPGAEVLLLDSRQDRALGGQGMPVMAIQGFGAGETVFIGTDETYRWRSRKGEERYARVWSSIMQSLSLKRLQGASSRTQLRADRERYFVGDKVVISGKVYNEGFEAMSAGTLQGRVTITGNEKAPQSAGRTINFDLNAVADQPAEYRGEMIAREPGQYSFATFQDPKALVKFEVIEPRIEQMETAMDNRLLENMAQTANGKFLREEDLNRLPDLVAKESATVATYKKIELFHSPWWMIFIFVALFAEWLMRRLKHLK